MQKRSGGEILVASLVAQGVTHLFGVPGESYLPVLDALVDVRDRLAFVTCRQEGGAAFMAEAAGKLTGRPGVAIVLMSASPTVLDMARERPELVRGVVAKPFSAEDVVAIVERLVAEHGPDLERAPGDEPHPDRGPGTR